MIHTIIGAAQRTVFALNHPKIVAAKRLSKAIHCQRLKEKHQPSTYAREMEQGRLQGAMVRDGDELCDSWPCGWRVLQASALDGGNAVLNKSAEECRRVTSSKQPLAAADPIPSMGPPPASPPHNALNRRT
jgi:hypothetical protein